LKSILIRDGRLKPFFRFVFVTAGVGVIFLDLNVWHTGWLHMFGFAVGGRGGFAARAHRLGIKPFEPPPYPAGWLKNRRAVKDVGVGDPDKPDL